MNTPEPEGGKTGKGHGPIKITLQASSKEPWVGSIIEHNGKKYRVGKDGSFDLMVNGGEVYANGHAITKLLREKISLGATEVVLRHDSWKGVLRPIEV